MSSKDARLEGIKKYRVYILWFMVFLSFLNAALRFWGEWEYFIGVLVGQLFFGQAAQSYFYDKYISFGGGGVRVEDGSVPRLIAFVLALIGYFTLFLFNGYPWG
jgi:hypothetical protein